MTLKDKLKLFLIKNAKLRVFPKTRAVTIKGIPQKPFRQDIYESIRDAMRKKGPKVATQARSEIQPQPLRKFKPIPRHPGKDPLSQTMY